jgi:hypothetical protein
MISFLVGVFVRQSYKAIDRSLPQLAKISGSAGLNLTDNTVSHPHSNELAGASLFMSHKFTQFPAVANISLPQ